MAEKISYSTGIRICWLTIIALKVGVSRLGAVSINIKSKVLRPFRMFLSRNNWSVGIILPKRVLLISLLFGKRYKFSYGVVEKSSKVIGSLLMSRVPKSFLGVCFTQ